MSSRGNPAPRAWAGRAQITENCSDARKACCTPVQPSQARLRSRKRAILCCAGRGGALLQADGTGRKVSREETKRRFKVRGAGVLGCTDAAAEGLSFQFCGALVNVDMPWNPTRVEQRIGRVDRLGQQFERIAIVNLMHEHTAGTDVCSALRALIPLLTAVVGKLQPRKPEQGRGKEKQPRDRNL